MKLSPDRVLTGPASSGERLLAVLALFTIERSEWTVEAAAGGTPEMKDKLYQQGFQVRPKGAKDEWARVTKEIVLFKDIIEQAGIKKL